MPNLLLDPAQWRNGDLISPPPEWNGTAYVFTSSAGATGSFYLDYIGASPAPNDTFSGSLAFSNEDALPGFLLLVEPGVSVLDSAPLTSGQTTVFEFAAVVGSRLIIANNDAENTNPTAYYGINASATPMVVSNTCDSAMRLGRVTTGYPSAYSAAQNQPRRIRRHQIRHLKVDFNGAILPDELIESVRWDCTSPWALYMSDAAISSDRKSTCVNVSFNFGGLGAIKCTVTLNTGGKENYQFLWTVIDQPLYPSANYDLANGPFYLEAVAA